MQIHNKFKNAKKKDQVRAEVMADPELEIQEECLILPLIILTHLVKEGKIIF